MDLRYDSTQPLNTVLHRPYSVGVFVWPPSFHIKKGDENEKGRWYTDYQISSINIESKGLVGVTPLVDLPDRLKKITALVIDDIEDAIACLQEQRDRLKAELARLEYGVSEEITEAIIERDLGGKRPK